MERKGDEMDWKWTKEQADKHLHESGVIFNLGQISPSVARHLDRVAPYKSSRVAWPYIHFSTCFKKAWAVFPLPQERTGS